MGGQSGGHSSGGGDGGRRSPSREKELERVLDSGVDKLPPNQPRGLLGDVNPDLRKPEDFTPDLNAGVSQENDWPVIWLAIVLAYLVFFPAAYVILWRSKRLSRRSKIVISIVGAIGIVAFGLRLALG